MVKTSENSPGQKKSLPCFHRLQKIERFSWQKFDLFLQMRTEKNKENKTLENDYGKTNKMIDEYKKTWKRNFYVGKLNDLD